MSRPRPRFGALPPPPSSGFGALSPPPFECRSAIKVRFWSVYGGNAHADAPIPSTARPQVAPGGVLGASVRFGCCQGLKKRETAADGADGADGVDGCNGADNGDGAGGDRAEDEPEKKHK